MRALEALERHYPWIDPAGSSFPHGWWAPRDAQYALDLTVERCRTREQQDAAVAALRFKTEVLWAQLDAIERGDTQPPTGRRRVPAWSPARGCGTTRCARSTCC